MKYYPHTPGDIQEMLNSIGADSVDSLFSDIPDGKKIKGLNIPAPLSEEELVSRLSGMAKKNRTYYDRPSFLGAGAYRHFSLAVVDAVISRSEFYTAYTPYQAEASQGILQSIFEYQTLICMLTGMDVSNASLYDGSTACAEAVSLAVNHANKKEVLYSAGLHPEYVEVLKTYFKHAKDVVLKEIPLKDGVTSLEDIKNMTSTETAGVIIQNPNCLGFIEPAKEEGEIIKTQNPKTLYIIAVLEPHSLGLLKNPGECGADIAVGEGAGMGLPPSFGGPFLGFMATKNAFMRKIPGRLVGKTVDHNGKRAFCLTLQAREQHIRREKAISNICSNEALCALAATVYLSAVGKKGFKDLARVNLSKSSYLKTRLLEVPGFEILNDKPFFNEFTVKCPVNPENIVSYLEENMITGGFPTGRWRSDWNGMMTFCATEMNTKKEIDDLADCLSAYCRKEDGAVCTTV